MKRARRRLLCSCHHDRDAHRHYRPGSDCALCECRRWSPWNPVPRLVRRWARLSPRSPLPATYRWNAGDLSGATALWTLSERRPFPAATFTVGRLRLTIRKRASQIHAVELGVSS
jgi:hypothetical protein